jgi:hypothetical protein
VVARPYNEHTVCLVRNTTGSWEISADFRELKFTHTGAHVLDEVPDTRKRQCEVFSPLPLDIAESYCIRLLGSSARPLEAMMR